MPQAGIDQARRWQLAGALSAGGLILAALILVPPGQLPYPPASDFSDAALSHWRAADFLRQSVWQNGQWPLWNPLRMLGAPFAANPLNKVWYPPQWLALIFPPTFHLNLMIYLHMAWLGLGMIFWARAEGWRPFTALFGALAWGLMPKLLAHLGAGHLDVVYALAWVPWLFWAVRRGMATGSPARRGMVLGLVAALLALADLRIAFYFLPAAAVYGLVLAAQAKSWRHFFVMGMTGVTIFLLLTAVQTIPLMALSASLTRAAMTPADAAVYSLPSGYFLGLLFANVGGFHEWMTYLGLPVLVLAFAAFANKERRGFVFLWLALIVMASLWALGDGGPLFPAAARILPAVSWFRVPSRAWFVAAFGMVLLSLSGLEALRQSGLSKWGRLAAAALAASGLALLAGGLLMPSLPGSVTGAGAALMLTGVGVILFGLSWPEPDTRPLEGVLGNLPSILLLTVQFVSCLWLGSTLVEGRTVESIEPLDQAIIAALDGTCECVYSPSFNLLGIHAAQAGLSTLHAVDPFQLAWSADAVAAAAGVTPEGYSVTAPPLPTDVDDVSQALESAEMDADLLAALGVQCVVSQFPVAGDAFRLAGEVEGAYLYEVSGGTPQFVAADDVSAPLVPAAEGADPVISSGPNVLVETTINIPPGGESLVLVLPQAWAPGWRAWLDGERVTVVKVGSVLAGIEIATPGAHTVRVVYRPLADVVGMLTSGGTVIILAVWALVLRRKDRVDG